MSYKGIIIIESFVGNDSHIPKVEKEQTSYARFFHAVLPSQRVK